MTAEEFNVIYPVGTKCTYYPLNDGRGNLVKDNPTYPALPTKTRSEAWALGHGAVVVAVDGKSGGVSIDHITIDE